jgi:parallel beta-helix repeat protein
VVIQDHALTADLGPCPGHGLVLRQGVRLDCRGFAILGAGGTTEQYGVFLEGRPGREVVGAAVRGCRVSGFRRGIRLRTAARSLIADNVVTGNGDFAAGVGYGIDVAGASTETLLEGNRVEGNADEGVHIGRGSHGSRLIGNTITDNQRESLYVLGADRGRFSGNTLGGSGSNSLYLKDSSANRFEDNRFLRRPARVIGESRDNAFHGNTFVGAGIHFQDYRGGGRPRGNRLVGGTITTEGDCVRFTNAGGNLIEDTALGACRVSGEATQGPVRNTLVGVPRVQTDLDPASTLEIAWRLAVRVQGPDGRPLPGVRLAARDAAGLDLFTATTDAAGSIPAQVVVAEERTGDGGRSTQPIRLTATAPGFGVHTETLGLGGHVSLLITLSPR